MELYWLDRIEKHRKKVTAFALCLLGLGFLRGWLGWMLGLMRGSNDYRLAFDLGCVFAALVCIVIVYKIRLLMSKGVVVFGSVVLILFGSVCGLVVESGIAVPAAVVCVLYFLCAAGDVTLTLLWIEIYGLITPITAITAYTGSCIISSVIWFCQQGMSASLNAVVSLLLPILSLALLIVSIRRLGLKDFHVEKPSGIWSYRNIILWTWIFALVYGIGSAITGLGYSTVAAKLGTALPAAIILLGIIFYGDRFDYSLIYRLALVLMIAGFVICLASGELPGVVQLCMSASNELIVTLAVTFACGIARLRKVSSVAIYGYVYLGWHLIAVLSAEGTRLLHVQLAPESFQTAVPVLAIVTLLVAALFLFREVDFLRHWDAIRHVSAQDIDDDLDLHCEHLATSGALSERERSVLLLLAQGKKSQEIADDLFVAPGTVRAHVNHIYEKLDVHSREELMELLEKS